MRQLILFRHAKSEPSRLDSEDHDRQLATIGWSDAEIVIRHVVENGFRPELILCSTAMRCRQTYDAVKDLFAGVPLQYSDELYLAYPERLYESARCACEETGHGAIMVIAHNPGLRELASRLAPMDAPRAGELRNSFPTSSVAVLDKDEAAETGWRLTSYVRRDDFGAVASEDA